MGSTRIFNLKQSKKGNEKEMKTRNLIKVDVDHIKNMFK